MNVKLPAGFAGWTEKLPRQGDNAALCPLCEGRSRVNKTACARNGLLTRYRRCPACGYQYKTVELYAFGDMASLRERGE